MLYLGGSFFFYILANHMNRQQVLKFWTLSYLTDIVKNILFTVSIFIFSKNRQKQKNDKPSIPNLDMTLI
jgi:hypothetical protein